MSHSVIVIDHNYSSVTKIKNTHQKRKCEKNIKSQSTREYWNVKYIPMALNLHWLFVVTVIIKANPHNDNQFERKRKKKESENNLFTLLTRQIDELDVIRIETMYAVRINRFNRFSARKLTLLRCCSFFFCFLRNKVCPPKWHFESLVGEDERPKWEIEKSIGHRNVCVCVFF